MKSIFTPILPVILGPTACGKTRLAALLAHKLGGEIISADSRQVFRGMTIGTGKDYEDYYVDGVQIPFHLVDIRDAGYEYNVFEFQQDFIQTFEEIVSRNKFPVLCGGTGMYIESVLNEYKLVAVPENEALRKELNQKNNEELITLLSQHRNLHNTTDITDRSRTIRAIEIELYLNENSDLKVPLPIFKPLIFGVNFDREIVRNRITQRLKVRLESGMIEEVQALLNSGLTHSQLMFYGLEYKYITQYLDHQISYNEMFTLLNTAIHQFAKRQNTWFRRMERNGTQIHWLSPNLTLQEKVEEIAEIIQKSR
jgi:tRNA dimethylallyltransferase